jgi:hypothetical protein
MRFHHFLPLAILIAAVGCQPIAEEGIDLPGAPDASFEWEYLYVDTAAMPYVDSNRVVFTSLAGDGFLHFWDFGNNLTSNAIQDTTFYPQSGDYAVTYSVYGAGGSGVATQTVPIANTVELPCEGTLALLTGCDNQKTWIFSGEAGAISVGPQPGSSEWYSSPVAGLVPEQYDDSYQFTTDGEYFYDNNGGTVNPYEGYVVTELAVPDTLSYLLFDGAGLNGEDQIYLPQDEFGFCWFMGVWDAGPTFDIVELTEDRLVVSAPIQLGDCTNGEGYFTLYFAAQ